jgi:hypothetical protein
MPSVLEAPETLPQALTTQAVEAIPALDTPRPSWFRIITRLGKLRPRATKRSLPMYGYAEEAPRPPEAPLDRLARELPQTFLLGHCG